MIIYGMRMKLISLRTNKIDLTSFRPETPEMGTSKLSSNTN